MSLPNALDTAIIAAMQADANATQRAVRKATGATEHYFSEAVKRLRYAGKIQWDRFALSPSMQAQQVSPAAVGLPPAAVEAKEGAGTARRDDRRKHAAGQTLPGPSNRPGDDLLIRIDAYCRDTGTEPTKIGKLLFGHWGFVGLLRKRGSLTDEKRRAVEYLLDLHPEGLGLLNDPVSPDVRRTLTEIDAMGLIAKKAGPKAITSAGRSDHDIPAEEVTAMQHRADDARAKREPGESVADRFRRIAAELDEEEADALAEAEADERRERDLERLPSPSAVLRRAQRDWPDQCEAVKAIAEEIGIGLGECWRRVIKAGVDCLREAGDEGVRA